jgi:hypothetical protein
VTIIGRARPGCTEKETTTTGAMDINALVRISGLWPQIRAFWPRWCSRCAGNLALKTSSCSYDAPGDTRHRRTFYPAGAFCSQERDEPGR